MRRACAASLFTRPPLFECEQQKVAIGRRAKLSIAPAPRREKEQVLMVVEWVEPVESEWTVIENGSAVTLNQIAGIDWTFSELTDW
jgi:hypothetical protein